MRQITIVGLHPEARTRAAFNQLCVDADTVASALHAAFKQMRYAKFQADFPQVARCAACILHDRRAADDLQIRDLCQVGQDFVVYAVRKKRIGFLFT